MRPGFAIGTPGMPVTSSFASLEHTSNGILVHYQEAGRRRHKNPSPLAGLDMSYFAAIFEMVAAQMDSGSDEWEDEKKRKRMEKIRDILKSAKAPTEDKYTEQWVAEPKAIFCKDLSEVPAAIQKAYEAYLGILSIMKEGDHVLATDVIGFA